MNTKSYIFAGIIAAITMGNAYATGENTVTSKSYVDAQDALKQDLIGTGLINLNAGKANVSLPAFVTYDTTNDIAGNQVGLFSTNSFDGTSLEGANMFDTLIFNNVNNIVPSIGVINNMYNVLNTSKQILIPSSGKVNNAGSGITDILIDTSGGGALTNLWLDSSIKGTGLVTKTSIDGHVGERKIFEASDVSGYHDTNLSQNEKDIQDISIPTVGAMMSAISSGATAALPTGTTGTVVTYNGTTNGVQQFTETAIASSATHNPQTGALTNGSDIANVTLVETEIATRETKMTCAGWPDSVAVADRTDANCWLWQRN